ncbi:MAG: tetratricopeptide repeat protein, partial [Flavobacteriia bacterium]
MKRLAIKTLIAGAMLTGLGSCTNYHIRQGNNYYEHFGYSEAIPHFETAYRKTKDTDVELKLADSYFRISKLDSAEAIYKRAVDRGSRSPKLYFNYGKVLMASG